MLTGIDHLVIAVPDIAQAIERYTKLGFHIFPGGAHSGRGTESAIVFHEDQYLELIAIRDAEEHRAAAARDVTADAGLADFVAAGGGIRAIALASDDLEADVAAMRARGVEISDTATVERVTPGGQRLRTIEAVPRDATLALRFVQHLDDLEARRKQVPKCAPHPNGSIEIDGIYVAGPDLGALVAQYHAALGGPDPAERAGHIIKADMRLFQYGPSALLLAQANGPGPTATALETRGTGPFQVIHRTTSFTGTGKWLDAHGFTPIASARRSTGEMTVVVGASDGLGCNLGFVGPED